MWLSDAITAERPRVGRRDSGMLQRLRDYVVRRSALQLVVLAVNSILH